MSKLCVIINIASNYREAIYRMIDNTWNCEWYFGINTTDIKDLEKGILKREKYVKTKKIFKSLKWMSGTGNLIRKKENNNFLMIGEPKILSTWWILIQRRLFFRKKKVFLWTHGWYGRESFSKKWLKRIYFGMADHIFTYGEYAKKQAIKQGFKESKITFVHNSLNYENQRNLRKQISDSDIYKKHFGNNHPTLIFIGRITKEKRIDLLIQALHKLQQNDFFINLIIIGKGEDLENIQSLTDSFNLKEFIWFYGACYDDKELASLIYNADLCVSPGNIGLTAIHSMAFGTPALTHNTFPYQGPEFEAIKKDKTGAFFTHDNLESLAEEIKRWLEKNINNRRTIRKECYKEIETNWNTDFQISQFKKVIL